MGYIITGICCFAVGSIAGIICISLCCAAKSRDDIKTSTDDCYGCLGASFGDCEYCPKTKKGNSENEK